MKKLWSVVAVLGALGVAFGAFGAHALEDYFAQHADMEAIYETAAKYHLIHAAALVGLLAASQSITNHKVLKITAWLWIVGTVIFSGSLYILSMTEIKVLGAITPIGGLCFIIGWFNLARIQPITKN